MTDKRMLILPADLVKKIDDNRGDMSQAEFIDFLISSRLKGTTTEDGNHSFVTQETLSQFEGEIKELLRSFLDFFISYGLELGQKSETKETETLSQTLDSLATPSHKKKNSA